MERLERRVRVEVDEPGAEHQPFGVDDVSLDARPDRGDAPVRHADVRAERRAVARVDLGTSEDEHYEDGEQAAVDVQDLPVDEVGGGRGEEDDGAAELGRVAPAPGGDTLLEPRDELRALLQVAVHLGAEVAGPDAVRLDAEPRPVRAHRPRQLAQSALRRRVRADRLAPQLARRRAGVDDLPAAALDHLRHHGAGDEERARQVRVEHAAPFVE